MKKLLSAIQDPKVLAPLVSIMPLVALSVTVVLAIAQPSAHGL